MRATFQIFVPFHRQELFFGVVAAFTAGDHIAAGAFTAACNRYDMVHCQFFGRSFLFAVLALALGQLAFPPLGFPQFPGLAAFAFQIRFTQIIGERLDGFSFFHFSNWRGCLVFGAQTRICIHKFHTKHQT